MSDRTAWAFNRPEATRALHISEGFDRVWHAGLRHKPKSYGISGQVFGLISSFLSNRWLWVVLDGKTSQEYQVNAGFLKAPFLVLHFSYYQLMTCLMTDNISVIVLFMLIILLSKCDQAFDLWQQLELASELESDLRDIVDWGRRWLGDVNSGKTQLGLTGLITLVLLM